MTEHDAFWGRMNDPIGSAHVRGPCGDEMEIYLDIRDGVVREARYYTGRGCENTKRCGRAVASRVQGQRVDDALSLSPREVIDGIPELDPTGDHCAILAVTTLYRALADYLLKP